MNLLFIHGAGCLPDVFAQQRGVFPSACYQQLPGHGIPGEPGTIEEFADAVDADIRSENMHDIVLCGSSMGGAIALTLAVRKPSYLRGIALIGSGARLRVAPQFIDGLRNDFLNTALTFAGYFFADPTPERIDASVAMMQLVGQAQMIRDLTACNAFDVTAQLGEIGVPLLALVGEADALTPVKYSEFVAAKVPNGRVVVIAGAGHLAMIEKPEATNAALVEYVTSLSV